VGPLFYYELVRMARQGRTTLVRCGYVLALSVALFLAYRSRFPDHDLLAAPLAPPALPPNELSWLAEDFAFAILWAQTIAVFALAPAYAAGAVAEERERGTLDLLLTTHLTDREVLLGKLAARVTHLGGVLLAGLPLLAILQLWGGVELRPLLAATLATGMSLLSFAAVSLYCSVRSRTVGDALAASYSAVVMVVPALCCLPAGIAITPVGMFTAIRGSFDPSGWLWGRLWGLLNPVVACLLYHGLAVLVSVVLATRSFRRSDLWEGAGAAGAKPKRRPKKARPAQPVREPAPLPPVGDWPLLWKEARKRRDSVFPAGVERWFLLALPVLLCLAYLAGRRLLGGEPGSLDENIRQLFEACITGTTLGFVASSYFFVSYRAATSVSDELDRKTLDGLRTLPVPRWTIPGAKWLAAVLAARMFAYALAMAVAFGTGARLVDPAAALLLVALFAAQVALLASLGVWVSLAFGTTRRALVAMTVLLLLFYGGSSIALDLDRDAELARQAINARTGPLESPGLTRLHYYQVGLNPAGAWFFLATSDPTFREDAIANPHYKTRLRATAVGAGVYALLAGALWLDVCRRFRRFQER
jgi:ABC-type transport system involved in multi-copper enzyme maturation permease subunit